MELIIALISAASGFAVKSLWQAYVDRKIEIESEMWKRRVSELEQRLSKFYWPIYLRLQKDNVVWEKILERSNDLDMDRKKLGYQIEKDVLLPNHIEILEIIEKNIHLAKPDQDFEQQIMQYIRHVDVYRAIRAAGIFDKDPLHFNEPYPHGLFEAVKLRVQILQSEYDAVLSLQKKG
jgi:hypothetical protein